jgi:hypothetical protein
MILGVRLPSALPILNMNKATRQVLLGPFHPTYEHAKLVGQILETVIECGPLQYLEVGKKKVPTTNIFGFHHSKARKLVEDILKNYNITPK